MKKSKIIIGLSAAFVSVLAVVSCGTYVKAKDGVVLEYNGVEYTADMLYNDDHSSAGAEAKFNAVYKVAVRQYFKNGQEETMKRIAKDVENKISGEKATAQSNADKNGTSYDTEWQKILDSNNCEDEQELYDKFEYDFQSTEFDDQFYEQNFDVLKSGGYLGKNTDDANPLKLEETEKMDGYLKAKYPYHVKHILVKVSAAEKDFTTGEITSAEAIKLSNVIQELAKGTDFAQVAKWYSDDTGSAGDNGGDLGIMDADTSFVNEFKLGTYLFESYFDNLTSEANVGSIYQPSIAKEGLGLGNNTLAGDYAENIASLVDTVRGIYGDPTNENTIEVGGYRGIGQIPYEAALMLGGEDVKWDVTTTGENGEQVTIHKQGVAELDDSKKHFAELGQGVEVKAKYLPRNIVFNKYFNKRNLMVITPTNMPDVKVGDTVDSEFKKRLHDDVYSVKPNDNFKNLDGFKVEHKNGEELKAGSGISQEVLRDQNGRMIFCFRSGTSGDSSYQGIHFVCIERSPFIGLEFEDQTDAHKAGVSLEEYYTHYYPGQEGTKDEHQHPKYDNGDDKLTYVSYFNTIDVKEKKSRADSVKSKIKGYDGNLKNHIFRYLVAKGDLKFADTDLGKNLKNDIETWIDIKREGDKYDKDRTWNETWKSFSEALLEQTLERQPLNISADANKPDYIGGTITQAALDAFVNWEKGVNDDEIVNAYGNGGIFHE